MKAKPRTKKEKQDVLDALGTLKKKFEKRDWFDWVGTGHYEDEEGKHFVLFVASKTKPSARRVNQCVECKGYEVVICGPWPKKKKG